MLLNTTKDKTEKEEGEDPQKKKRKNAAAPERTHGKKKSAERSARTPNPLPAGFPATGNAAIFLDVDGTLLDIAPRPQEVVVPAKLRGTLQRLYRNLGGAVAFVSGRPLSDIDRIFAPLRFPAVGGHGAELRPEHDGKIHSREHAQFDPQLKTALYEVSRIGPGIIFEDKDYSVALHYRLAPQLGGEVMDAVSAVWERFGKIPFEILPGKAVIEIKPRGFDKGSGLRALMAHAPFKGRRPVFIGDDVTDHAAFAVLPEFDGIGFSVGGAVPGAAFNFDGPGHVRQWLEAVSRLAPKAKTS